MDTSTSLDEKLQRLTYVIEHSPICSMPYLVRLPRPGIGVIDKLPYAGGGKITKDILGFGKTTEDAAKMAMDRYEEARVEFLKKFCAIK